MPTYKKLHVATRGLKHTKAGSKLSLTRSDLAELARSYNPSLHQCKVAVDDINTAIQLGAPAVLGHFDPRLVEAKGAMPAFGRVLSAEASGDSLYLDLELTNQLAEWLTEGLYDHVSVSWYDRDDTRNPTPGQLHLRHVGWLGAEPSAMKDLALPDPSFIEWSEGASDVYQLVSNIEFMESPMDKTTATAPVTDPSALGNTAPVTEGPTVTDGVDPILLLTSVLQDGPKGYKGEISEYRPEPTPDNTFLWNEQAQEFRGQFVDLSGNDEEVYDFSLVKQPDGSMIRNYKRLFVDDTAPADATVEGEADAADTEFSEYGDLSQPVSVPQAGYAAPQGSVMLSRDEYTALLNASNRVAELEQERQMNMRNEKLEGIISLLQPLYDLGLVDPSTPAALFADAIVRLDMGNAGVNDDDDDYCCEFSEGVTYVDPMDTLTAMLSGIATKATGLVEMPIEFGEMKIDGGKGSSESGGVKKPAGTTSDPAQAKLDRSARAICKENGWDPGKSKDYIKALKLAQQA